jgi:hypothetical protein
VESSTESSSRKWMTTAQRLHTDVAVAICREPFTGTPAEGGTLLSEETLYTGSINYKAVHLSSQRFSKTCPEQCTLPTFSPISIAAEARLLMIRREDQFTYRLGWADSFACSASLSFRDNTLVCTLEVQSTSNLNCAVRAAGRLWLTMPHLCSCLH